MPPGVLSTIVKIAIVSLLVGLALSFFGLSPRNVLENLGGAVRDVYEMALSFLRWSFEYILIGAVVVVPIWLVFFLLRLMRGKR